MIEYNGFFDSIRESTLSALCASLPEATERGLCTARFGDLPSWYQALAQLPEPVPSTTNFRDGVVIGKGSDLSDEQSQTMKLTLQALIPWRKGPFHLYGVDIDTEWRSDWKWSRLEPHIHSLSGRTVLDVGCGNGYHCWRMWGAGARRVVGIDPSPRFVVQFYMIRKLLGQPVPVDVLPVGIEALPPNLNAFDTTFSMGVLYHRRSPMDHLKELKDTLRPGGELVLETLVIEGALGQTLVPEGRYAMMNNVWFLPTSATLASWMKKIGFRDVRVVDETTTTTEEQRATEWMRFHSLPQFLDPSDSSRTIEGYPAPRRAVLVAKN